MFLGGFLLRWIARVGGARQNTIADMTLYITAWAFVASVLIDNAWVRLGVAALVITQLVRFVNSAVLVKMPGEAKEDTISRAYFLIDLAMDMAGDDPKEIALIRGLINASEEERAAVIEALNRMGTNNETAHGH